MTLATALLAGGCGTTVPLTQQQLAGPGNGSAAPAQEPLRGGIPAASAQTTTQAGLENASSHSSTAFGTAAQSPSAAQSDPHGGATPSGSGGAPVGGAAGRSAASSLLIGLEYSSDYTQTMSSLGFSGLSSGDLPALLNTIVADINSHGGILGRRLTVVLHDTSTAQAESDPAGAAQSVCTDLLQDHHANFVITTTAISNDCFVQARIPEVQYATITPDGADRAFLAARTPYIYEPSTFESDELYPLELDRLSAMGYFNGWDTSLGAAGSAPIKVGILSSNQPSEQRQALDVQTLLAQRHIDVASTFQYDASSAASIESGVAASVLRFASAGVTHVIGLDGNVTLFMIQAEQQHYRPRYAINTFLGPESVQEQLDPKAQLNGALGVGWEPVNDVDPSHDDFTNSARSACDAYIRKSGQDLSGQPTAQFAAYSLCDAMQILVQGARLSGSTAASGIRAGVSALGSSFPSALNMAAAYSAQMSAEAHAVRDLRYDNGCSCFLYASSYLYS